jgi:pimeloyl-ACP methyl ester carboxylesterase
MHSIRSIATRHGTLSVIDSGGVGFPFVLLHGSGSRKEIFAPLLAERVTSNTRIIAIDLPGHGASADAVDPEAAYGIAGLAEAVVDVIDALSLSAFGLLGWSLGGHLGIEVLGRDARVKGLMVVGAPPVSPGPLGMLRAFQTNFDLLLASKEHFTERDTQRFFELCFHGNGGPEDLAAVQRADGRLRPVFVRSMMRGEGVDQRRVVEETSVPLAIINGADEPFARLSYVRSLLYRRLWDGYCYEMEGAGHAPFIDLPGAFGDLFLRFAGDVAAEADAPARVLRRAG